MFVLNNIILPFSFIILPLIFLVYFTKISKTTTKSNNPQLEYALPKPYPIIGHLLAFSALSGQEIFEWLSKIIAFSPTNTVQIHLPVGRWSVYTANPANVEHILKKRFDIYQKGRQIKTVFRDLFGDSLFTEDGQSWKAQRLILAQQFTHKALQDYVDKAVAFEVSERLIPVLSDAAKNNKVIDLQDIFQRFAFDNICSIAFGYDPGYLTLPLPEAKFTKAFDECITICHARFHSIFPIIWKTCRFLNIGSEKKLRDLVCEIHDLTGSMIESIKNKKINKEARNEGNLLVNLLECDQFDEKLVSDIVIAFILAGRDTSSAALTWFFWLLHKNKNVESEIINEVNIYNQKIKHTTSNSNSNSNPTSSIVLEALKGMTYTQAALSETMRLYPPVPVEIKQVSEDDVWPDGTKVKKGSIVGYFAQSMGWSEKLWGSDWAKFRPDRWLKEDNDNVTNEKRWSYVARDAYSYPVFLAGPRVCLGKEMAYLQMKSVAAAILSRFKVVPTFKDVFEPVYFIETVANMHGGFPVRIQERV